MESTTSPLSYIFLTSDEQEKNVTEQAFTQGEEGQKRFGEEDPCGRHLMDILANLGYSPARSYSNNGYIQYSAQKGNSF